LRHVASFDGLGRFAYRKRRCGSLVANLSAHRRDAAQVG
jgi:hypothetical protein